MEDEPLFGRANVIMKLTPFALPVLKQILTEHAPDHTNDDLLALYTVTGGIPKYVELLVDAKALSVKKIIHAVCDPDSPFKDEGKTLLIDEFGKQYGTYFSILDAISNGINTQSEIAEALGVARPTLNRWITNGWLEPCRVQISAGGDTLFAANAVREVLERFR